MAQHEIGKSGCEVFAIFQFANAFRRVVHRRTNIKKDIGFKIGFFFVFLDVESIRFSENFPIDMLYGIARHVLSVFCIFDAESMIGTVMQSGRARARTSSGVGV